jgi:hypothetical protein
MGKDIALPEVTQHATVPRPIRWGEGGRRPGEGFCPSLPDLRPARTLGAGGAYLGHELSNGDPLITAAGAAGGVIVSETIHYAARKQAKKAYPCSRRSNRSLPTCAKRNSARP